MNTDEKLIYMANQIGAFFAPQDAKRAVTGIADHIRLNWTTNMRRELAALAVNDASKLSPNVREAVKLIDPSPANPAG